MPLRPVRRSLSTMSMTLRWSADWSAFSELVVIAFGSTGVAEGRELSHSVLLLAMVALVLGAGADIFFSAIQESKPVREKTRAVAGERKADGCGNWRPYLVSGDVGNRTVKVKMRMKASGTVAVANTGGYQHAAPTNLEHSIWLCSCCLLQTPLWKACSFSSF
jgi:hypothetical protein